MAEEIVIFDIDGTLADISERVHHVRRKPRNWNAFNEGMAKDKAIRSMVRLYNILYASGPHIILCSGRNEKNRPEMNCFLGRMKTFAPTRLSNAKFSRRSTRARSYSLSKIEAGWSKCGDRKVSFVCNVRRVNFEITEVSTLQ